MVLSPSTLPPLRFLDKVWSVMARKTIYGMCHVCGTYAGLTEEHVPPRATPNKNTYIELTFDQVIRVGPEEIPQGPKRQGGIRFPSLCGRCNNNFGSWYVPALNESYWGGEYVLRRMEERGLDAATFSGRNVYPLRIIKAVIAMFMAVNPERFRSELVGAALARLLLDKEAKGLPEGVRFYTYFNHAGQLRYLPLMEAYRVTEETTLDNLLSDRSLHVSEITYPPYGFLMALDWNGINPRLFDISHFAGFDYDQSATAELELAVLPTYIGTIPNDYRTLEEVRRDEQRAVEEAIRQGIDPNTI